MNISRYLSTDLIRLQMISQFDPPDAESGVYTRKQLHSIKESIISEMVDLLDTSGNVSNKNKLKTDLFNREKKASTALGEGIAIPHVRTMQARELTIAVGRNRDGYEFEAPDGLPVKLFFCMAAPPYDDSLYLKVFKALAERLQIPGFIDQLLDAEDEHIIIRLFKQHD